MINELLALGFGAVMLAIGYVCGWQMTERKFAVPLPIQNNGITVPGYEEPVIMYGVHKEYKQVVVYTGEGSYDLQYGLTTWWFGNRYNRCGEVWRHPMIEQKDMYASFEAVAWNEPHHLSHWFYSVKEAEEFISEWCK